MLGKFLKDRLSELNAVTWPTQKQAIHSSVTVLVIMFVIGLLLTLMDAGLNEIVNKFILQIS